MGRFLRNYSLTITDHSPKSLIVQNWVRKQFANPPTALQYCSNTALDLTTLLWTCSKHVNVEQLLHLLVSPMYLRSESSPRNHQLWDPPPQSSPLFVGTQTAERERRKSLSIVSCGGGYKTLNRIVRQAGVTQISRTQTRKRIRASASKLTGVETGFSDSLTLWTL